MEKRLYVVGIVAGAVGLLSPALALADMRAHIDANQQVQIGLSGVNVSDENGDSVHADSGDSATSSGHSERMDADHQDAAGISNEQDANNNDQEGDATSSIKEDDHGGDILGIGVFMHWLFGLPASTTVGQVRTEMQASTTADAHGDQESGDNFFAHFFARLSSFFGF